MFCSECGTTVTDGAKFCESCGTSIIATAETQGVEAEQVTSQSQLSNSQIKASPTIGAKKLFIFLVAFIGILVLATSKTNESTQDNVPSHQADNLAKSNSSKNLLEEALDPFTSSNQKWSEFVDNGGLNNENDFYGMPVGSINASRKSDGSLSLAIMYVSRSVAPKSIRLALNQACKTKESDWSIEDEISLKGEARNGNVNCMYITSDVPTSDYEVSIRVGNEVLPKRSENKVLPSVSQTLNIPSEESGNYEILCKQEWTKRGVLDQSMFNRCMNNQRDGYRSWVLEVEKYSNQNWIQSVIDEAIKSWTKRNVRNDFMVNFEIRRMTDAWEDLVYMAKQPGWDARKFEACQQRWGVNFALVLLCIENN